MLFFFLKFTWSLFSKKKKAWNLVFIHRLLKTSSLLLIIENILFYVLMSTSINFLSYLSNRMLRWHCLINMIWTKKLSLCLVGWKGEKGKGRREMKGKIGVFTIWLRKENEKEGKWDGWFSTQSFTTKYKLHKKKKKKIKFS